MTVTPPSEKIDMNWQNTSSQILHFGSVVRGLLLEVSYLIKYVRMRKQWMEEKEGMVTFLCVKWLEELP